MAVLDVGAGLAFGTIQAAIDAAAAGDTVLIAAGSYAGTVTLKDGVDIQGAGEGVVTLVGTVIAPATVSGVTVSHLTVESASETSLLLDLRGTHTLSDVVFDHVTFSVTRDLAHAQTPPIGNGDDGVSIALVDADGDGAGLTFRDVTAKSNGHTVTNPDGNVLAYLTMHGARLVLDGVDVSGTVAAGGQGAQWNMETGGLPGALSLIGSRTSGGGNFYVSAFTDVTIEGNDFDGQGIALNGVENANVEGNSFRNIDGAFTANGEHRRGLTFENAWWGGGNSVSNVTVTGNVFINISVTDGAIAFQRWTDSVGNPVDAGIDLLNDIDIHGNTFVTVVQPLFLSSNSFSATLIEALAGEDQLIIGTAGNDILDDPAGGAAMIGGPGADVFVYAAGNGATVIVDFEPGTDRIEMIDTPIALAFIGSALLFLPALLGITTQVGADAIMDFGGGDTLTLSGVSKTALTRGDFTSTAPDSGVRAHDDAYVILQGHTIAVQASAGVLANDSVSLPATATLLGAAAHGQLLVSADGAVSYSPSAGFAGIDSFTYRASDTNGAGDARALIHVVPVQAGATTTLDLVALSAEEQVAAMYAAFLGRGGDNDGFEYWVNALNVGRTTQAPSALLAGIANSFAVSDEAMALHPFLVDPLGATDAQIGTFLDTVYDNLFNRAPDAEGETYWANQVKAALASGKLVGSVVVDIMSGAQDSAAGEDITTLMSKVAVGLHYVHQQQEHDMHWSGAADLAAARALLGPVTSDPQTLLIGMRTADATVEGHA